MLIFQGVSHYFQGFIHPRWLFGISSIKSMFSSNGNTFFLDIKPTQEAYSDGENDGTLGMVHLILNPTYTLIVGIYWPPFSLYPQICCNKCFIPPEELHNKLLDGSEIRQAPVDMVNISLFTGFYTSQVVYPWV